jgi:hypothetical protein
VYELFLSNEHVQKYNPMCQVFFSLWGEAEGESVAGMGEGIMVSRREKRIEERGRERGQGE